jgi:hypothetical protein
LPESIKQISYAAKEFKDTLKKFFSINLFYSLEDYFST